MRFLATCCKTARGMPTYGSGCMYAHVLCIVCTRIHVCVVWILIVKNVVPIYMCECILHVGVISQLSTVCGTV